MLPFEGPFSPRQCVTKVVKDYQWVLLHTQETCLSLQLL